MDQDDISFFYEQSPTYSSQSEYFAFFSSYNNFYTIDPKLMLIPIDDHIVHRGDGVFEAFKMIDGKIYLFDDHMDRLKASAKKIGINIKTSPFEIKNICLKLSKISSQNKGVFRLYLSRGPGKFSTNPYDSIGSQLYIVFTSLGTLSKEIYEKGGSLGVSNFKHKEPFFAQIKSCNYLLNVLMKKEAVDRNFNFTVTFTEKNFLAEGSTENICLVNTKNEILYPSFNYTLAGTTLKRLIQLSPNLIDQKIISAIVEKDINLEDVNAAKEIFMIGTTLDAIPITIFENKQVGDGLPGAVTKAVYNLLKEDQTQ